MKAKHAPAPAELRRARAAVCGDGVAEGTEECDDGDTTSGDGCSSTCQLESTRRRCAPACRPSPAPRSTRSVLVPGGLTRPLL